MRVPRSVLKGIAIGVLVLVVAGVAVGFFGLMSGNGSQGSSSTRTSSSPVRHYAFPFGPGDYVTLRVVRRLVFLANHTSTVLDQYSVTYRIDRISWPFTTVSVVNTSYTRVIPTIELAMPTNLLGKNITGVVSVSLFHDTACFPFKLFRHTNNTYIYEAGTPGTCKSVTVTGVYDEHGALDRLVVQYVIGSTLYQEIISLVAYSTSNPISITVQGEPVCISYYSKELRYTLPGAYVFLPDRAYVLYDFSKILSRRPLLIIDKNHDGAEGIWKNLPGNYVGGVIVVSPMAKIWEIPMKFLSLVQKYGAVLILSSNKTITGIGNVEAYILTHQAK